MSGLSFKIYSNITTVRIASAIESGIWVYANTIMNLKNAAPKLGIGNAKESCEAVVIYVNISPAKAAKNTAIDDDKPVFMIDLYINHAANGPIIPIEKIFAPNVVIPPWPEEVPEKPIQ